MLKHIFITLAIILPCVTASHATTCAYDEYLVADTCRKCPASATCDGIDFTCVDGFYKNGSVCSQCSVNNSTCTSVNDYTCLSGFYDNNGACLTCPQNAVCDGSTTFHCTNGYYKRTNRGVTTCESCANAVCDGEKLVSCKLGYYLHNSGMCYTCNRGYYCPLGQIGIVCDNGYYKDSNGLCGACATGYYCPRDEMNYKTQYRYCTAGYYRAGDSCTKCDDDTECPGGKPENMTCSDGLFLHDDGRCLPYAPGNPGTVPNCNPGYYNAGDTCTACVSNSTCTSSTEFTCMAGYYKNGNACDICPDNSTCPAGSTQINCWDGYWLDGNKCSQCGKDGYYCYDNIRYPCPTPTADNVKFASDGNIIKYKLGSFGTESSTIAQCDLCTIWISAPAGEFFRGMYWSANNNAYTSNSQRNWYLVNTGYYLANPWDSSGSVYYADSLPCTNAPDNAYYTDSGTPGGNDCPWRCNDGFYRDANVCKICPNGMDCLGGSIVCELGMYADGDHCVACPDNYADNPNRGAQSVNDCQIKCNGGSYLATAGAQICTNVGAGYWNGITYTNYNSVGTRNKCPYNLTTVGYGTGADESGDCGRILHINDYQIYLRTDKKTEKVFCATDGVRTYYGNMSPGRIGRLRTEIHGVTYSIYDDTNADTPAADGE